MEVESGEWKVESGKWRVESAAAWGSEKWKAESGTAVVLGSEQWKVEVQRLISVWKSGTCKAQRFMVQKSGNWEVQIPKA